MRDHGVGSWPARRARTAPDDPAIVHGEQTLTYADVLERSTRLAHALRGLGVGRGDRVAYLGPNAATYAEALFAAGMLGAALVPMNTRLAAPELRYVLDDAQPRALLWSPACEPVVAELAADGALPPLIGIDTEAHGSQDLASLRAAAPADPIDEPVGPDELCMIQYTSGTSGRPKGVMLTHDNVWANVVNLLIDVDLRTDEVTLVAAPMFHTAGMNNNLLPTFVKGGTAVMMDAWDPQAALALIERHRITCVLGVPTMLQMLTEADGWARADLSSVRTLLCGGGPMPTALIDVYHQRGIEVIQGYGLTETSPNATFLRASHAVSKAGSVGTPCFLTDVRLQPAGDTSDEGAAAAGRRGEVCIEGPNVTPGYLNRQEATAQALLDGWLHSGDVGRFDDDGFLFIVDRLKDMIISGGENIYPAEIEDALFSHPDVAECAVVGVADPTWGEVPLAFVVPRGEAAADPDDLRAHLEQRLARYKVPKRYQRVAALPRNATGKLLKHELRRTAQERT